MSQDPIAPDVEATPEPPQFSASMSTRKLNSEAAAKPSRFSKYFYEFDSPETEKKFAEFQVRVCSFDDVLVERCRKLQVVQSNTGH